MDFSKLHTHADLALAAYGSGFLPGLLTTSDQLARLGPVTGAGMALTQAVQFAEAGWLVVAQFADPLTGASATVFEDSEGSRYLAVRGTEPSSGDILSDVMLATVVPSTLNPQFLSLRGQLDKWINGEKNSAGELVSAPILTGEFTVTGHSLGGYLAAALKAAFPANITDAYLFNAPGVGGVSANLVSLFQNAFGLEPPSGADGIWNVRGVEGLSFITGLGVQLSEPIPIQIEGDPGLGLGNHSIVRLVDALAVHALYAELLPSASLANLNRVADVTGQNRGLAPDGALDALRRFVLGASASLTGDSREQLYTNLAGVRTVLSGTGLLDAPSVSLIDLSGKTAAELVSMASSGSADSAAVRRALQALTPFALTGFAAPDFASEPREYWAARAEMLTRLTWFNENNLAAYNPQRSFSAEAVYHAYELQPLLFKDTASELAVQQGNFPSSTQHIYFGDGHSNTYAGGGLADQLFGGDGHDTLYGNGGDDFLYGGLGNDNLFGGTGNDTYFYRKGDGNDTITLGGGSDTLRVSGLSANAVTLAQDGTAAVINLDDGASIKVTDFFTNEAPLQFQFADNSTLALTRSEYDQNTYELTAHDSTGALRTEQTLVKGMGNYGTAYAADGTVKSWYAGLDGYHSTNITYPDGATESFGADPSGGSWDSKYASNQSGYYHSYDGLGGYWKSVNYSQSSGYSQYSNGSGYGYSVFDGSYYLSESFSSWGYNLSWQKNGQSYSHWTYSNGGWGTQKYDGTVNYTWTVSSSGAVTARAYWDNGTVFKRDTSATGAELYSWSAPSGEHAWYHINSGENLSVLYGVRYADGSQTQYVEYLNGGTQLTKYSPVEGNFTKNVSADGSITEFKSNPSGQREWLKWDAHGSLYYYAIGQAGSSTLQLQDTSTTYVAPSVVPNPALSSTFENLRDNFGAYLTAPAIDKPAFSF